MGSCLCSAAEFYRRVFLFDTLCCFSRSRLRFILGLSCGWFAGRFRSRFCCSGILLRLLFFGVVLLLLLLLLIGLIFIWSRSIW